jgi:hypothetical protein
MNQIMNHYETTLY